MSDQRSAEAPEWWKESYDDFHQRTGFGSLPPERTAGDIDAVERFLDLRAPAKVLDLFCGTGRHCIELARRGYDATGVDYSGEYLALARSRAADAGVSPRFLQGDAREMDLGSGYDAVLIMWASFGFFDDEGDRLIVRRIAGALRPGGSLYMEIKNRDWEVRHFAPTFERKVEDVVIRSGNSFDVMQSRLEMRLTFSLAGRTWNQFRSWRLYSAHEIRGLLDSAGFVVSGIYGDSRGAPLTMESHLMRVAARKAGGVSA